MNALRMHGIWLIYPHYKWKRQFRTNSTNKKNEKGGLCSSLDSMGEKTPILFEYSILVY